MSDEIDDTEPEFPAVELDAGVRSVLARGDTWAEPPADLEASILAAMRLERDAPAVDRGESDTNVVPIAASASAGTSADTASSTQQQRRSRRAMVWVVGVAAALVAVAGVGIAVQRSVAPEATIALNSLDADATVRGEAELRETPSGVRIDLDLVGLPPAPDGSYYQGWLKNSAGELVTIGTFHARDGARDIVLWSGVETDDYDLLTITIQQEGAGAESSGVVVLSGSLP